MKKLFSFISLGLVLFFFIFSYTKAGFADIERIPGPIISRVEVDEIQGTLAIEGRNFGNILPTVVLGGTRLTVLSHTPENIVAQLPSGIQHGTYRLSVSVLATTPQASVSAPFSVAIGAVFYKRTIVVSPVPGDALASGAVLLMALNNITDASVDNSYLIKIEPGVYDLGNNALQMKEYVDIEGSGELSTKIIAPSSLIDSLVCGASNAELRFLTLERTNAEMCATVISNVNASPKLTHVIVRAASSLCNRGISNSNGSPVINSATIIAENGGGTNFAVLNTDSSGNIVITDSKLKGTTNSIMNQGAYTVNVVSSQLIGSVDNSGSGTFHCIGAYDGNYAALPSNCGAQGPCTDADGDGYYVQEGCGTAVDCNDNDPAIHPGAPEYCNGIDDDCSGVADDHNPVDATTYYEDADADGYGFGGEMIIACTQPPGYVINGDDCDDHNPDIHPGAEELCDGIDNDCNGQVDDIVEAPLCENQNGVCAGSVKICSGGNGWLSCDASNYGPHYEDPEVSCDGLDNDCDIEVDEGCPPAKR